MKKEILICDRCGKEIEHDVENFSFTRGFYRKKLEAKIETTEAQRNGYLIDDYLTLPDVKSMRVVEYYDTKTKSYHLCPDCRRDFERFMKNENR